MCEVWEMEKRDCVVSNKFWGRRTMILVSCSYCNKVLLFREFTGKLFLLVMEDGKFKVKFLIILEFGGFLIFGYKEEI